MATPGGARSPGTTGDDVPRAPAGTLVRAHAVEVAVVAAVLAASAVVLVADRWLMLALVAGAPIAAAASVVDARTRRIPTRLAAATAAVGVLGLGVGAASTGAWESYTRALVAGAAVGAFYLVLWRIAGVGAGDVRLGAALGVFAGWSSWQTVAAFVVVAHLFMLPLALSQFARGRTGDVPFAPALVAGVYLAIPLTGLAA